MSDVDVEALMASTQASDGSWLKRLENVAFRVSQKGSAPHWRAAHRRPH